MYSTLSEAPLEEISDARGDSFAAFQLYPTKDDQLTDSLVRRADEPPEITYRNGGTCEYLARGERTEGRFGFFLWATGDTETGPDPHFHRSISEQFYVLSGEVNLYDGRAWITARSGDFLYVPEGGVHGEFSGLVAEQLFVAPPPAATMPPRPPPPELARLPSKLAPDLKVMSQILP